MRHLTRLGRTASVLVSSAIVAAGLGVVVTQSAQAAPSLGTLAITPSTGNESTGLSATLSAPCPTSATGIVGYMAGPGITEQVGGVAQSVIQPNRSVSTSFQVSVIFRDIFQANAIAQPSGSYTVRMVCIGSDSFSEVGEFAQTIAFTPRSGTNNATYTTVSSVPTTSTALTVGTADPVRAGTPTSLTATVTPSSAIGTVTFKSDDAALSPAPVPVSGGTATLSGAVLAAGTQNLTAVFTPTDSNAFSGSTSAARPYVVAGPTSISGSLQVGSTVACVSVATPGATTTYAWQRAGETSSVTAPTFTIPSTWAGASATCTATTTKSGTSVSQTSAASGPIAVGAASVLTKAPRIKGTFKVGKKLTCSSGTWSPAASQYTYQWLRNGKAIARATKTSYKLKSSDRKKRITCKVSAVRPGYTTGVASARAKKVK